MLKLSETLRFTLYETNNELIPLKKEIKFLENYIELEKTNQNGNVDIRYDFMEIENDKSLIAPLLLINLVESALKHEVNEYWDKHLVEIKLCQTKQTLLFESRNNMPIKQNAITLLGLGLTNIKIRLNILYPDKHTLEIQDNNGLIKINLTLNLD